MTLGTNEAFGLEKFVVGPLATNCYILYEKHSLKGILIDPGAYDEEVSSFIQDKKIDILFTLNTHGHLDHIMGNASFGFPVMIHRLDEACLHDAGKSLAFLLDEPFQPREVKTERLLDDGDIIEVGSLKLHVIHTPGHSPGGISVKFGSVLFSGDTLFFEGIGRTDLEGGSYEKIVKSIKEKLFTLPDSVKVYPGHGPETTIGHEKRHNPML